MKFIVSKSEIYDQLQLISGVVVAKPIIPILGNFLFDINDGILTISASDLQTTMTTLIKVDATENAKITVPSKLTLDILRSLPDQPLTFTLDEKTETLEINSGNGRFKIGCFSAADFPEIPAPTADNSLTIQSSALLKAISRTINASGTDELRLNLTGILFELKTDHINFVATDANRLVKYTRNDVTSEVEHTFILPKKPASLLKSALKNDNTPVRIDFNNENAFFNFGDIYLACRLIDERYPDYNSVIPKENPNLLQIDRSDFLDSVKRISILSNNTTHQIRLKIKGSDLIISAEDFDQSNEGHERLVCEYAGEDIEIGFNSKYLIELLGNINTERIKFEHSPGIHIENLRTKELQNISS